MWPQPGAGGGGPDRRPPCLLRRAVPHSHQGPSPREALEGGTGKPGAREDEGACFPGLGLPELRRSPPALGLPAVRGPAGHDEKPATSSQGRQTHRACVRETSTEPADGSASLASLPTRPWPLEAQSEASARAGWAGMELGAMATHLLGLLPPQAGWHLDHTRWVVASLMKSILFFFFFSMTVISQ